MAASSSTQRLPSDPNWSYDWHQVYDPSGTCHLGENYLIFGPDAAPKSTIRLESIEKFALNLIKANDRNGLRRLCNILFSGPYLPFLRNTFGSESIEKLQQILYSNAKWEEFRKLESAELVKTAAAEWRANYKREVAKLECDPTTLAKMQPYFQEHGEEEVEISHGGGYESICDFLNGKLSGYKLEKGGVGIQVHPKLTKNGRVIDYGNRNEDYAIGAAPPQFDLPAIFKAKIQLKHLLPAPNFYEAGLPSRSIQYLKDISVTQIYYQHSLTPYT